MSNHGLFPGDRITISGAAATSGVPASRINCEHRVARAERDRVFFELSWAAMCSANDRGGCVTIATAGSLQANLDAPNSMGTLLGFDGAGTTHEMPTPARTPCLWQAPTTTASSAHHSSVARSRPCPVGAMCSPPQYSAGKCHLQCVLCRGQEFRLSYRAELSGSSGGRRRGTSFRSWGPGLLTEPPSHLPAIGIPPNSVFPCQSEGLKKAQCTSQHRRWRAHSLRAQAAPLARGRLR